MKKYQIKIENEKDYIIFYNSYDFVGIKYPHYPIYVAMNDDTLEHISFNPFSYLTTYTFQEWKLKIMKTNKTFICPFDLAEGIVKAGTLYKRYLDSPFYTPNGEFSQYSLPQEIVEQWQEAPQFKVGDYVQLSGAIGKVIKEWSNYVNIKWITGNIVSEIYEAKYLRLATSEEILKARYLEIQDKKVIVYGHHIIYENTSYDSDNLELMYSLLTNTACNISIGKDFPIKLDKKIMNLFFSTMNKWKH